MRPGLIALMTPIWNQRRSSCRAKEKIGYAFKWIGIVILKTTNHHITETIAVHITYACDWFSQPAICNVVLIGPISHIWVTKPGRRAEVNIRPAFVTFGVVSPGRTDDHVSVPIAIQIPSRSDRPTQGLIRCTTLYHPIVGCRESGSRAQE